MAGPDAKYETRLQGASIVDVAPTVLALLGLHVPDWMDGKVLVAGMSEEFLARSSPAVPDEESPASKQAKGRPYTEAEEAEITKRLADLGYLE